MDEERAKLLQMVMDPENRPVVEAMFDGLTDISDTQVGPGKLPQQCAYASWWLSKGPV